MKTLDVKNIEKWKLSMFWQSFYRQILPVHHIDRLQLSFSRDDNAMMSEIALQSWMKITLAAKASRQRQVVKRFHKMFLKYYVAHAQ